MVDRARTALVSDPRRYWASAAVVTVTTIAGAGALLALGAPVRADRFWIVVGYFVPWVQVCLAYCAITWWVLRPLDGAALSRYLHESTADRKRRRRAESIYATGGPTGAIVLCGIALAAVLGVALIGELRQRPLVVGLAVAVVAATWMLLIVVYAVHYAREQVNTGGLAFPGPEGGDGPTFVDFVYLAVQVAASLASSDVAVTRTSMRREVATHTVIAFVFNTVVVALLVSVLVSNAG